MSGAAIVEGHPLRSRYRNITTRLLQVYDFPGLSGLSSTRSNVLLDAPLTQAADGRGQNIKEISMEQIRNYRKGGFNATPASQGGAQ